MHPDEDNKIYTIIDGKRVYLDRYIMGVTDPNIEVVHLDGDNLNCRTENMKLRWIESGGDVVVTERKTRKKKEGNDKCQNL